MNNIFAKRLRKLRLEKELYQSDLAELLKVSQSFISKLEKGTKEPSVEMLVSLCDFLDTTPNFLLGYDNEQNTAKDIEK